MTSFKPLCFFFFILSFFYSFSQDQQKSVELTWYSWNDGIERSAQSKRPVLLYAYIESCVNCRKMENEVFSDPKVIDYLRKYFVPVKINPETNGTHYLFNGKSVTVYHLFNLLVKTTELKYPAYIVVFPDGNKASLEEGYYKSHLFIKLLDIYRRM